MREAGLISKWINDFIPKTTKCSVTNQRREPLTRISLVHLSGAFAIFLGGLYAIIFLTSNVLLIETCFYWDLADWYNLRNVQGDYCCLFILAQNRVVVPGRSCQNHYRREERESTGQSSFSQSTVKK